MESKNELSLDWNLRAPIIKESRTKIMIYHAVSSFLYPLKSPLKAFKWAKKVIPEIIIKNVVTQSKYGVSNEAKESFFVENPPVEMVLNAWFMASKVLIDPKNS